MSTTGLRVELPGRPDDVFRLSWAALTDTGLRRSANEDSYIARSPIFAVADGMGGHSAGDLASAAVVKRLSEEATADFLPKEAVGRALALATADIEGFADETLLGVGTTATGAVLGLSEGQPHFVVFNVGDSRVYRFADDRLEQVTVDHSLVQEMVDAGLIGPEQAEGHPDSNIITRSVGFGELPATDYWTVPVLSGLRLLICSDGLTKELPDELISLHLAAGFDAHKTATALVTAALAAGGRDNVTVVVVDVVEAPVDSELESTAPRSGG